MRLEAFGHFWNFRIFRIFGEDFVDFRSCLDLGGLFLFRSEGNGIIGELARTTGTIGEKFSRVPRFFGSFSSCSDVFECFRMCLDPFGPVRMQSNAF